MAGNHKDEQKALAAAAAQAYRDQCKALLVRDMEHVRAAFWNRLPEQSRIMVCHIAGVGKNKGKGALRDMSASERAAVHATARRLIADLETVLRCATGGAIEDRSHEVAGVIADRSHQFNGIAAPETVQ